MATVKKVAKTSDEARARANARENAKSRMAKAGYAATWEAAQREHENRARKESGTSKPKTVKINSNPVPGKTRIGNMAGGGLGGMFGIKNR